jgi:hypothetical protein
MSDCEKYFGSIEELIEAELDQRATQETELHVLACKQCGKQYERLRLEREIYAQYLFNVEPPRESWIDFQGRLNSENGKAPSGVSAGLPSRRRRIFVLGFSPAWGVFAGLSLIVGISLIWWKAASVVESGHKYVTASGGHGSQSAPRTSENDLDGIALPRNGEQTSNNLPLKTKYEAADGKRGKSASIITSTEVKRLSSQTQDLDKKIAGQVENVELLLRSFRNARTTESFETYDVDYEKTRARKLLGINAQLRREAENYGISYTPELLSRIEPYLLDIANLESNPAPSKILDIKERVVNQNIIASLQVYK